MIGPPPARLRILVVDNEDANLLFLERALSRKGHQVILAHTGEEALALYERVQPDLVLMELMLPGWDGFETTRRIRAGGGQGMRWVPLIFLSSAGRTADLVRGLAAGGDDYLVKPVDLALLESKIAAMQRIALLQKELEARTDQLAEAHAATDRQREASAKIFRRLMRPDSPPRHVQFRVLPCERFSGDLVAAAEGPDGSIYLMVADAAGHGMEAAASVLPLVAKFYALAERGHTLTRIAQGMNRQVHELLPTPHFIAGILVKADPALRTVEVLNAGMPAALLVSPAGECLRLFSSSFLPFGLQPLGDAGYLPQLEHLEPGDQVVAFSDGLTESGAEDGAPFGQTGVEAALRAAYAPDSRLASILAAYDRHRAGRKARDDVSIAVLTMPAQSQPAGVAAGTDPSGLYCPSSFSLTLGPAQLRDRNLLAHVSHALADTGLIPAYLVGQVFYALKELLANAVDYGLLGMESRSKQDTSPAARKAWHDERQERLERLQSGSVTLRLNTEPSDSGPAWCLEVSDSGPGLAALPNVPSEGGLARINQATGFPVIHQGGSNITVRFAPQAPMPAKTMGGASNRTTAEP